MSSQWKDDHDEMIEREKRRKDAFLQGEESAYSFLLILLERGQDRKIIASQCRKRLSTIKDERLALSNND